MPRRVVIRKKSTRQNMKKKTKEPTAIGQLIRALGSAGGAYLGGYAGQAGLGGAAGHQLGAMASKWLGFGDYHVTKNSILTKSSDSIPFMHKEDQGIILRHKEFVGTLTSTTDFTVQYQMPLNPGMVTFPWLKDIAAKFQEYRFRGVVFHYIPASGAAISGTNSALGTVMLQTTYRPSDSAPASKVEMLNEYCANEVVPSESVIHPIECDPKQNPFAVQFVRSIPVPAGESILNYDLGKTFIATQGQQAIGNYLGDIWVTYEVELIKPVYSSNITTNALSDFEFSGATTTAYFDTPLTSVDTMGLTFSGRTITFPAGCGTRFVIVLSFVDSHLSLNTWGGTTTTNGTVNWVRTSTVASGNANVMLAACFTKIDSSRPSVVTLSALTATGTLNIAAVQVARAD